MNSREDAGKSRPRCCVKNCQKELGEADRVPIGDQVFCKACAVLYFKDMLTPDMEYDED
nr:hypothetical protein [Candidatus Sigynarchaeota archaeon]